MRNVLVLGSVLCALFAAGCDGAFVADLKCGKDGKIKGGELELILLGDEDSQAELDNATCEELKDAKSELKLIKLAVGKLCNDEFKPVVFSKKYEVEDENCDGYLDISYEFSVKKLVCEGLLDKNTEELLVGVYVKDEETCEWELVDGGAFPVVTKEEWEEKFGCEDECDDSKDCEQENDCEEKETKKDCEKNGDGNNTNGNSTNGSSTNGCKKNETPS
jgi:hypothetical protein